MALGPISTNFTEGNWNLWDVANCSRAAPLEAHGCGGGPSNSCNANSQLQLDFGFLVHNFTDPVSIVGSSPGWKQLVVKFQYGIFASENFDPRDNNYSIVGITDGISNQIGDTEFMFSATFNILYNGTLQMGFSVGNTEGGQNTKTVYYNSTSGLFPMDGSLHAIQIILKNLTPQSVDYTVVLDNVTVLNGTHVPTGFPSNSYGYYIPVMVFQQEAGIYQVAVTHFRKIKDGANILMSNCAQFTATDENAITNYPPCNPVNIIKASTCFVAPTPPPGEGIYFIHPTKPARHDSYYTAVEKKIPNPTIKTTLLGE